VPIEDLIIKTFCVIDDELQQIIKDKVIRRGGFDPQLTDSEKKLTMDLRVIYRLVPKGLLLELP
jgi:hypothetical protein